MEDPRNKQGNFELLGTKPNSLVLLGALSRNVRFGVPLLEADNTTKSNNRCKDTNTVKGKKKGQCV